MKAICFQNYFTNFITAIVEFFTIRSNLNFKPEFKSRGFEKFQQKIKLPAVRVLPSSKCLVGTKRKHFPYIWVCDRTKHYGFFSHF